MQHASSSASAEVFSYTCIAANKPTSKFSFTKVPTFKFFFTKATYKFLLFFISNICELVDLLSMGPISFPQLWKNSFFGLILYFHGAKQQKY